MEFGDVQIYATPERNAWRSHWARIFMILTAVLALGVAGLYF